MKLALAAVALAMLGFFLDRMLLWMEWKGWIDYRRTDPGRMNSGQVGPAFLAIQELLEPEKRHAAEEQMAPRTQRDDQGGDGPQPWSRPGA